ncbi:MAG: recombinase family protein, partial [Deltaproteobacteria bacterium]
MSKISSHKIALYIRVSTEEQASNPEGSIKSQEQRLRQHIEFKNLDSNFGSVTAVFIDRGKSGKNTNRPELQRLLKAIREKEVDFVLVTELSRLSRSIKDFSEIWELMRSVGCGFQSLREQFDTTTAAGEMVLYTMANLAQFERKQTSERISANFKARAERGLSNGGSSPVGYKCHPVKKGYLVVVEEEAKIVRAAFKTFLEEGCLSKAGLSLNNRGYKLPRRRENGNRRARLGHFTIENLHDILKNPAYMGKRRAIINEEPKLVKAVWEPIISETTFNRVQAILKKNHRRYKSPSEGRYPYQLSGLLFCKSCGDRLCGKTAHGRIGKVAYYEHSWATRRQACLNKKIFSCNPNRILAKTLEHHVWEKVEELLKRPETGTDLINKAKEKHGKSSHVTEIKRVKNKLLGIN